MRRRRKLVIIAGVLVLHLGLVWLIVDNSRISTRPPAIAALEFIFLPLATKSAIAVQLQRAPQTSDTPHGAIRRRTSAIPVLPTPTPSTATAISTADNSIGQTPDWNGELGQAADAAVSKEAGPRARDFGFPKRAAPAPKPKEFEWDYAATHRVESLPQGGIVVHLNDNCVLVLFPLPFGGCAIGKRPANGQLFEHLRDPQSPSLGASAP